MGDARQRERVLWRRAGPEHGDDERGPDPVAEGGRALTGPAALLTLQSLAGNRAVGSLVRTGTLAPIGDGGAGLKTDDGGGGMPAEVPTAPVTAEEVEGDGEPTGGTLPPIEDDPLEKEGCEAQDRQGVPGAGPAIAEEPAGGGPRIPVEANITFAARARQGPLPPGAEHGHSHGDPVASTLALGNKVEQKGAVSPFGAEYVTYKVDNISWAAAAGKVTINARVFLDITWNTNSGGKTPIMTANDAAVTAVTWKKVADDLQTDATGRPSRTTYWAPALTEKHERFHAQDDIDRATLYLPTAKADLDAKTIAAPATDAKVRTLLDAMKDKVKADGWAWYGAGGENRAYADGKASYDALSADVTARATTEGWPP